MPLRQSADLGKRPVRRAKQARSKNTVEAIIEATTRILATDGWDRLNTNAIAEKAGVSIGSVYEYFTNKQEIVDVIIDRHLARGETYLQKFAGQPADSYSLEQIVQVLVAGFVEIHKDDPRLHRVLSGEIPLSEAQRDRVIQIRNKAIALVTYLLESRIQNAALKATMMIDAADAVTHRWFVDEVGTPVSPEVMSQELARMLGLYIST